MLTWSLSFIALAFIAGALWLGRTAGDAATFTKVVFAAALVIAAVTFLFGRRA